MTPKETPGRIYMWRWLLYLIVGVSLLLLLRHYLWECRMWGETYEKMW